MVSEYSSRDTETRSRALSDEMNTVDGDEIPMDLESRRGSISKYADLGMGALTDQSNLRKKQRHKLRQ